MRLRSSTSSSTARTTPSSRSSATSIPTRCARSSPSSSATGRAPAAYARVPEPFVPNKPAALKFEVADKANAFLIGREAMPLNDVSPDYPAHARGELHPRRLAVVAALGAAAAEGRPVLRRRAASSGRVRSSRTARFGVYAIFAPENLDKVRAGFAEEIARRAEGRLHRRRGQDRQGRPAAGAPAAHAPRTAAWPAHLVSQAYLGRTWATLRPRSTRDREADDGRRQRGAAQVREAGRVRASRSPAISRRRSNRARAATNAAAVDRPAFIFPWRRGRAYGPAGTTPARLQRHGAAVSLPLSIRQGPAMETVAAAKSKDAYRDYDRARPRHGARVLPPQPRAPDARVRAREEGGVPAVRPARR